MKKISYTILIAFMGVCLWVLPSSAGLDTTAPAGPDEITRTVVETKQQATCGSRDKKQAGSLANTNPIKIGEEVEETVESDHPYQGSGTVWEHTFHWPEASYISVHFSAFNLAPGDVLEISSPDGQTLHSYEGSGKVVRGGESVLSSFWSGRIPGDTALVRIYSTGETQGWGVSIDKWARGYAQALVNELLDADTPMSAEAICGADDKEWAKCYYGTTMYDKAKTVARLYINGTNACTGWLLGSNGHLMTNNHCIDSQSDADNTEYEFMAEGANCTTNCNSWLACPGTVEAFSGTLVRTNSPLDYSLILLPINLTPTYGYLQLRDTLPTIGERIYIPQHPQAWGKQLGVECDSCSGDYCEIYSTNQPPCSGGPGDIGYYCDTAGGSSGSPVLGYADHLVVALHHCANCPNRGVPIPSIITDLGSDLPDNAIGGSTPDDAFTIFNDGTADLDITAMSKRDNDAWLSWNPNAPFTISPGGSRDVTVTIDWDQVPPGGDDEQIVVTSNDTDNSPYPTGVYITATPACDEPPVIDSTNYDDCISELCQTDISVTAHDPCGGNLSYTWTALNGGSLSGSGASITFDPPDTGPHPCPYIIRLSIESDATGLITTRDFEITVKLAGDADGNGTVNVFDLRLIRNHFGETPASPGWDPRADVNCDGIVNVFDLRYVRNQFGSSGCSCPL